MILCKADESGQVLTLSYSRHVDVKDMKACLKIIQGLIKRLQPGFLLLSDLSHLESMDPACATDLGAVMDLLSSRGMSTAVRVIPDPAKDIGFNLISLFHYRKPVKAHTCANLAEGIKCLLTEHLTSAPGGDAPDLRP